MYSVGHKRLDLWIKEFIQNQSDHNVSSLSEFASNLKIDLENQILPAEKKHGSMIHIAGYVKENKQFHPEFWFVRNVTGIDNSTEEYTGFSNQFQVSEDFLNRDCPKHQLIEKFENGYYQYYINGFASGRISYNLLQGPVYEFFYQIWTNRDWKFRPPTSLNESKLLVKPGFHVAWDIIVKEKGEFSDQASQWGTAFHK